MSVSVSSWFILLFWNTAARLDAATPVFIEWTLSMFFPQLIVFVHWQNIKLNKLFRFIMYRMLDHSQYTACGEEMCYPEIFVITIVSLMNIL